MTKDTNLKDVELQTLKNPSVAINHLNVYRFEN